MPTEGNDVRPAKQQLWFPAGRYFLRTIKREDASERWAEWLSDPWTVHVLNTAQRRMTKSDIADYIKTFDQRERLLLGIFERGSRAHVGFVRLDIDFEHRKRWSTQLSARRNIATPAPPLIHSSRC